MGALQTWISLTKAVKHFPNLVGMNHVFVTGSYNFNYVLSVVLSLRRQKSATSSSITMKTLVWHCTCLTLCLWTERLLLSLLLMVSVYFKRAPFSRTSCAILYNSCLIDYWWWMNIFPGNIPDESRAMQLSPATVSASVGGAGKAKPAGLPSHVQNQVKIS